jgi:hypothetical protein
MKVFKLFHEKHFINHHLRRDSMLRNSFKVGASLLKSSLIMGLMFSGVVAGHMTPSAKAQINSAFTGAFTVTLSDGQVFSGKKDIEISLKEGTTAQVRGKFISYDVDLDTFVVTDYTLRSVFTKNQPTILFAAKKPWYKGEFDATLHVQINGSQLVLRRTGTGGYLNIQAQDSGSGTLFLMEAEQELVVTHTLGDGFWYSLDRAGRLLFTNGLIVGMESPKGADRISPEDAVVKGATETFWTLQGRGYLGMIIGKEQPHFSRGFREVPVSELN